MSEQDPDFRKHHSTEVLRYLPLSQDSEAQRAIRGARIVAGIIGFISGMGGVLVFFMASLGSSLRGGQSQTDWQSLACPGSIAAFLVLLTLYEHFYVKRRGFLQGMLIGLGLAALAEGACFTLLR